MSIRAMCEVEVRFDVGSEAVPGLVENAKALGFSFGASQQGNLYRVTLRLNAPLAIAQSAMSGLVEIYGDGASQSTTARPVDVYPAGT